MIEEVVCMVVMLNSCKKWQIKLDPINEYSTLD